MSTTLKVVPSSYTTNGTIGNPTRAYTDASSATYASLTIPQTAKHADYYFDFSMIPENAQIKSISAKCKFKKNKAANTGASARLYTNSGIMGEPVTGNTTATTYTFSSLGVWKVAELKSVYIRFSEAAIGVSDYLYIYGAEITVVYDEPADTLYTKSDGVWVPAKKAYRKASGVWVEQSDLTTVFDPGKSWVRGN